MDFVVGEGGVEVQYQGVWKWLGLVGEIVQVFYLDVGFFYDFLVYCLFGGFFGFYEVGQVGIEFFWEVGGMF